MDAAVQAWLLSELGTDTDTADLAARYTRLGTARAVALEVLNERLADLRAQVSVVGVSGVVNVSTTENMKAYEREIALLESGNVLGPDETATPSTDAADTIGIITLASRPRR